MNDKSTTLAIRVPHELRDRLAEIARLEKRTLSQLGRIVLEAYADDYESREPPAKRRR